MVLIILNFVGPLIRGHDVVVGVAAYSFVPPKCAITPGNYAMYTSVRDQVVSDWIKAKVDDVTIVGNRLHKLFSKFIR